MQVVSFVASCLGEPDMFGDISANSAVDFFDFIAEDAAVSNNLLLKEVIDELEKQTYLQAVSSENLSILFLKSIFCFRL